MDVIVTGAAGFIGSHLCERLLAQGHKVVGVDNFDNYYSPAIKENNIAECKQNKKFTLVKVDIRNVPAMEALIEQRPDVIVHLAAKAGVRPSILNPMLYYDVNINGTIVLLEAARKCNIEKFIFASSSSVYGNNKKIPFSEDDNVDFPISPYAATKKAGELICHTFSHLYDISITALRFFTVYGPRQRPDLAIHKFAKMIENDEPVTVFGDGTMMRDFTYVDDIIDGVMSAIEKCNGYNIYNLGHSHPISVNDLIAELEKALGKKADRIKLPLQAGDVERTYADVTKAEKELGYKTPTNIETGLASFVTWLRQSK